MPEHALRFGVIGNPGWRAETWKCWTYRGSGKRDVYLACRALGSALKLSLHESGRWHVSFDAKQFAQLFEDASAPSDRFIGKWKQPEPLVGDLTLACRIHVPWHAATIPDSSLDERVHWIECAPHGQSVEIAVFLQGRPPDESEWPGRDSMETKLVGQLPLEDSGSVCVVHRVCLPIDQKLPPMSSPHYFKGKSEEHLLGQANRALMWGVSDDGSVVFQESPIAVSKNEGS